MLAGPISNATAPPRRVLIAGCGDLGERVARRLLARGEAVWALRRHPPAQTDGGITWIAADLTNPASLGVLPAGLTQLVYTPTPDARDQAAYRAVFLDGLAHLLAAPAMAGVERALFVSSSAVYGDHDGGEVTEATPPAPAGFNGEVLVQAERLLAERARGALVLRLAGLYGPGRLQLIQRLRRGEVTAPRRHPVWGNRIHVDDAAAAIAHLLALGEPAPLYLGVDDTPLPLHVLYDALAEMAGAPSPVEGGPPRGIGSKRLSNARLRATGWAPVWPDARVGYAALLARQPWT